MSINAHQLEMMVKLLETAGTMAALVPVIGARWRLNRDRVLKMVEEGRDPTPEEHAELARELADLSGQLDAALETATAADPVPGEADGG